MPQTNRANQSRASSRRFAWAELPDAALLELRFRDLGLTLDGTWLADCLSDLHGELAARGLRVRPHAWLSDEWFSPDTMPGIAIPFYLAHPRLMRLERKMMLEVEGGTRAECMRILRHEAGHVVQQAFRLHRRRAWQNMFGKSSVPYPERYRPDPASRDYVQHLRLWYAQSHPDEDFAETFAVWLSRPAATWRKRYADWGALRKLEYVNALMEELKGSKPLVTSRATLDPISRLSGTLGEHYERRRRHYAIATPTSHDRDLQRIFSVSAESSAPPASAFIRKNRASIRRLVSQWTGEYELTIDAVLDEMIQRCRALKLRAAGDEAALRLHFTVLLTARTVHMLYSPSRRQWFAL